jgi:hypothetical protein
VKWFCANFEEAETTARYGGCDSARSDGDASRALDASTRARQQCVELINSGISQKRHRFHADAAKRCIDAQKALITDPARGRARHEAVIAACAGVVEGLLASGQSCESSLDCPAGLACLGQKGAPPGVCKARLDAGSACDDELLGGSHFYAAATASRSSCAAGLHCSAAGGELVCAKDAGDGAKCAGTDPGECGPGLRCSLSRCAAETRAALGQSCAVVNDCAIGLFCSSGKCALKKAAGAACKVSSECRGSCSSGRCKALCGSG